MGSKTVQFLLRAPPLPPSSRLFSLRHCNFPLASVANKRFYSVKSSLEPPDVPRLAETARISLTPQEVEEFAPKIRQVVDWYPLLSTYVSTFVELIVCIFVRIVRVEES
ncbi:hypothetical protein ACS0TY_012463 [Phlomoides rotata]